MTTRFGPPLIAGKTVLGVNSLGVLGSQVPAEGEHGGGLLAEAIAANGWAASEVRLLILEWPASGSLTVDEDTAATLTGAAAGLWPALGEVFVNGASQGTLQLFFYNGVTALVLEGQDIKNKTGIGGTDLKVLLSPGGAFVARQNPTAGDRFIAIELGVEVARVAF